ncbi:transporter [Candidatus Magnetomorum sp. HK-1]|nr:transporter [Candidatus Magnetomorum sp. HK-1]
MKTTKNAFSFCFFLFVLLQPSIYADTTEINTPKAFDLQQCIEVALKNNHQRKISKLSIEMAEAQYKQALSAFYPQINAGFSAVRMDEPHNFLFPEEVSQYQIQLPAQLMNPSAPPGAKIPMDTTVVVPEKNVKLLDRDTLLSRAEMTWPIYMGGYRRALAQRADIGIQSAKIYANRTDIQLIHDVSQKYYGALLSRILEKECKTVLDRFNVVMQLTEMLYKKSTGKIKKTDFLRMQLYVSFIQSTYADLCYRNTIAHAALANDMGMDNNDTPLKIADIKIPFKPVNNSYDQMLTNTYSFNPDWKLLELGLKEAESKIAEAQSAHFPVIALTGQLLHMDNEYDKGIATPENKDQWQLGIHINIPLFKGFRTQNEVRWAKARLKKLKEHKHLLEKGLALKLKDVFLKMKRAEQQVNIMKKGIKTAASYRKLSIASFQEGLLDADEVIESQFIESLSLAQYYKACFDHALSLVSMHHIIGKHINL